MTRRAELAESKTGPRSLYLGKPAADLLANQLRVGKYIFPGRNLRRPMVDLKGAWRRVKERAKLDDRSRLHDACRDTFTTWALELGVPLERVKSLIGHSTGDVTARHTHLRTSVLLEGADLVAARIDAALRGRDNRAHERSRTRHRGVRRQQEQLRELDIGIWRADRGKPTPERKMRGFGEAQ